MEEKINEYLSLYFIHGINTNGWTLVHNIKKFESVICVAKYGDWPQINVYRSDYGEVKMEYDKELPENTFFLCQPGTVVRKRCKCCGQTIPEGARMT